MAAPATLTTRDLNRATLARQGLLSPLSRVDPAVAIERLGSLQAQHPDWPPIALAARSADAPTADLRGSLDARRVVRSSLMRQTIHVVTASDLWPMFAVCQPMRLDVWRRLMKADPTTSTLGRRLLAGHGAVVDALRREPMSSLEIDRLLATIAGLDGTSGSRPSRTRSAQPMVPRAAWRHFAAHLALVHVPFEGEGYGRSRYALASDWLGHDPDPIPEDEARAHVARRYLAAFGPASVDDLISYVGRGRGGIGVWRQAIRDLGDETVTLHGEAGRDLVDLRDAPRPPADHPAPPRLLARWDSALLSHAPKHRARIIADADRSKVFSKNADVLPTILVDGFVAGTWELTRTSEHGIILLRPFRPLAAADADALVAEAERLLALAAPHVSKRSVSIGG